LECLFGCCAEHAATQLAIGHPFAVYEYTTSGRRDGRRQYFKIVGRKVVDESEFAECGHNELACREIVSQCGGSDVTSVPLLLPGGQKPIPQFSNGQTVPLHPRLPAGEYFGALVESENKTGLALGIIRNLAEVLMLAPDLLTPAPGLMLEKRQVWTGLRGSSGSGRIGHGTIRGRW